MNFASARKLVPCPRSHLGGVLPQCDAVLQLLVAQLCQLTLVIIGRKQTRHFCRHDVTTMTCVTCKCDHGDMVSYKGDYDDMVTRYHVCVITVTWYHVRVTMVTEHHKSVTIMKWRQGIM